jgi:hypothetical protein
MKHREEIKLLIQREMEMEEHLEKDPEKIREESGLVKSFIPFDGLRKDLKRKMKW